MKDFRVDKAFVDPRGWPVLDAEARQVGRVTDLVVDTDRMAASSLEVELDVKALDLSDAGRVLIPMALATRDGDRRQLVVRDLTRSRIVTMRQAWSEHEVRFWDQMWTPGEPARPPAAEMPGVSPVREVRVPVLDEAPAAQSEILTEDGTVVRTVDAPRSARVIE
jgi:sporulation protein YlmC with PRC-barrel domain